MNPVPPVTPITESRIYVLCPGKLVSGGPELLHQLVHALREEGRDAYIAYLPLGEPCATPEPFLRYECPVVTEIPDEADSAVVTPETAPRELARFRRARHIIWWLSVDNYRGAIGGASGWKIFVRRMLVTDIPSPRQTTHLFQSAYARDFVRERFGMGGFMLSDYLAPEFLAPPAGGVRQDAVAFNPSKGYAFTQALMRAFPQFSYVRLEKMSRAEMQATLERCKVYIDFGLHPGKDRIPREAAMRGAVVVVGRRGAARFDEDVPLQDRYKIAPGRAAVRHAGALIQDIFASHAAHQAAQRPYREAITAEPATFRRQMRLSFAIAP